MSGAQQYVPLEVSLLEQGGFLEQANADLRILQREFLAYVGEFGKDAAGAKAKLTLEITLFREKEGDAYSIKVQRKSTMPAPPAGVSQAFDAERQDGEPSLFVRRSGSTADSPKQNVLCTDDGKAIDSDSGEPQEPEPDTPEAEQPPPEPEAEESGLGSF